MSELSKKYPNVPDYEREFIGRATLRFIRDIQRDPVQRAKLEARVAARKARERAAKEGASCE